MAVPATRAGQLLVGRRPPAIHAALHRTPAEVDLLPEALRDPVRKLRAMAERYTAAHADLRAELDRANRLHSADVAAGARALADDAPTPKPKSEAAFAALERSATQLEALGGAVALLHAELEPLVAEQREPARAWIAEHRAEAVSTAQAALAAAVEAMASLDRWNRPAALVGAPQVKSDELLRDLGVIEGKLSGLLDPDSIVFGDLTSARIGDARSADRVAACSS